MGNTPHLEARQSEPPSWSRGRWAYSPSRGGLEIVSGGCGLRRAVERSSVGVKDPDAAQLGWKSVVAAAPICGETLGAEFAIPALVRTTKVMSS